MKFVQQNYNTNKYLQKQDIYQHGQNVYIG